MQGVEATGPPLPATSRIEGVSFPVADLNPNDLQNNCVYVTIAACLNMPLNQFLQGVNVQMTNEPGGVGLDYINFSPTENKSQIYVRHYLPHSNQLTASNHTDNHPPSFEAYDPETPRGLNGYQTTASASTTSSKSHPAISPATRSCTSAIPTSMVRTGEKTSRCF
jgi:hypothetical protein